MFSKQKNPSAIVKLPLAIRGNFLGSAADLIYFHGNTFMATMAPASERATKPDGRDLVAKPHRAKRRGNVVGRVNTKPLLKSEEGVNQQLDWRMRLRQTFLQQANDRHDRIRGHFYAGFPNAQPSWLHLNQKASIPAIWCYSDIFSAHSAPANALAYA